MLILSGCASSIANSATVLFPHRGIHGVQQGFTNLAQELFQIAAQRSVRGSQAVDEYGRDLREEFDIAHSGIPVETRTLVGQGRDGTFQLLKNLVAGAHVSVNSGNCRIDVAVLQVGKAVFVETKGKFL